MISRSRTSAFLIALQVVPACTVRSTRQIAPGDLPTDGAVILAARSVEDRGVRFDRPAPERMEKGVVLPSVPAATIRNDSLVGSVGGRSYAIQIDRVEELTIEEARTSTARTALMLGGIGLILLVATAPFLCPLC